MEKNKKRLKQKDNRIDRVRYLRESAQREDC